MRRAIKFLLICLALFYVGAGIYFFHKSVNKKKFVEAPVVSAILDTSELIILKEDFFDLEDGWKNDKELTTKEASSGNRSVFIPSQSEFAGEITQSFSGIPSFRSLRQVEITLKVFNETIHEGGTLWVFEIDGEDGKVLEWLSGNLAPGKKKWETRTFKFNVKPELIKNFNRVKTYAWNSKKNVCYIDDIRIRYLGVPSENPNTEFSSLRQTTFHFDLENDSSLENTHNLTDDFSHSGKLSSLMNGRKRRSVLISKKISEVMNDSIRAISGSVWIYSLDDNPECSLVFELRNEEDETVFSYAKKTGMLNIKANSWQKLNALFGLKPEDYTSIKPQDILYVYMINNCGTKVYVDDFTVSYGSVPESRGIQTFVDMNTLDHPPYKFRRNRAPYPVSYLNRTNINNDGSEFLIKDEERRFGELKPDDLICIGNFTGQKNGSDQLLQIANNSSLYYYCEEKSKFVQAGSIVISDDLSGKSFITADVNSDGKDELIAWSNGKMSIFTFSSIVQDCTDKNAAIESTTLWAGPISNSITHVFSGKFTGKKYDELLFADSLGNCAVSRYNSGNLSEVAAGKVPTEFIKMETNHIAGNFFRSGKDVLVSVFRDKHRSKVSVIEIKNQIVESRIIADREIPADVFDRDNRLFQIQRRGSIADDLLIFGHQWRFELNHISVDADGFYVVSGLDFKGYSSDQNPKYYEFPKILTGKFANGETSVLAILYNCADENFDGKSCIKYDRDPGLPNSIQLYSFQNEITRRK